MLIRFTLNGVDREFTGSGSENVRELLRERFHIYSIRGGDDDSGYTGNDTILLDGRPALAGLLLSGQLVNHQVDTVESLAPAGQLSDVQQAMVDAGVVMDGYNAPAAALLLTDLLQRCTTAEEGLNPPTRDQVCDALGGLFVRDCGYAPYFIAVELVAARRLGKKSKKTVAPAFRPELREIGSLRPKNDASALVRGMPAYVEDRVEPGSLHLHMLRSPHAHAYITSIDVSVARTMPGVVDILYWENCPDVPYTTAGQGAPEPSPHDRSLFTQKMRHVGDRVAAVLAESADQARAAAARISVSYEVLPPVLSIAAAAAKNAPVLHQGRISYGTGAPADLAKQNKEAQTRDGVVHYPFPIGAKPHANIAASIKGQLGDVAAGFAAAHTVLERSYTSSQVQCTPPEPHVCYARMDGECLVVHASTQVPWHVRRVVATITGLPQNRVRVIKERVGGGYGAKQDILVEDVTAYAAFVTQRPVFYVYSREECFMAGSTRHVMEIDMKVGAQEDGTLTALSMTVRANTGPYGSHCLTVPMNAASKTLPLFVCPHVAFDVTTYYSNIPPTGAYQGYGAPQGSFALQTVLAEMAEQLGMSYIELVEKNAVRVGDRLELLRILGEGREGVAATLESCGLREALTKGQQAFVRSAMAGRRKAAAWGRHWKVGTGCAVMQQGSGLPGLDQANARVALCSDGSVLVQQGGADVGTGLETALAKISAEVLCLPLAQVRVLAGDTDATPFDTGAYASSGTYFSGNAVLRAAQDLKKRILDTAAHMLQDPVTGKPAGPDSLILEYPGHIRRVDCAGPGISLTALARHCEAGHGPGPLVGQGSFVTEKHAIPYAAHFCQVAVNKRTGCVKVLGYHAVHDCGTPINPDLAVGQVYGGVLKALGHSLWEEMHLDPQGRCTNARLHSYAPPSIFDIPEDFQVTLLDGHDPNGPFGAKSLAEIATNGAAPAVAAAVHEAVGVWIRSWPCTPEKILQAMGKLKALPVKKDRSGQKSANMQTKA